MPHRMEKLKRPKKNLSSVTSAELHAGLNPQCLHVQGQQ